MKAKTTNLDFILQAKEDLNGKWGIAIAAFVVAYAVSIGIAEIPYVGEIALAIIGGAISLGMAIFSLSIVRKENTRFGQIFDGFRHFVKATGVYLLVIFLFVTIPLAIISAIFNKETFFAEMDTIFRVACIVVLLVVITIVTIMYSMTFFILADNPNIGVVEALTQSRKMMYGYKWKYFGLLLLSALFVLPLTVITFGIGLLFLIPIFEVAMARFYEYVKSNTAIIEIAE